MHEPVYIEHVPEYVEPHPAPVYVEPQHAPTYKEEPHHEVGYKEPHHETGYKAAKKTTTTTTTPAPVIEYDDALEDELDEEYDYDEGVVEEVEVTDDNQADYQEFLGADYEGGEYDYGGDYGDDYGGDDYNYFL